jgi:hypothetical protein
MIALRRHAPEDQRNSPTLFTGLLHTVSVLDDAYAQAFMQRFATWPEWNRPDLWPIVTDPKRSEQRRWLSDALADLPADQAAKLLGRLETNRSFQATYNELAVTVLLRESGLTVQYEPELPWQGKVLTPDIGLRGNDGGLAVIVEVSTKFRTAEQRSHEVEWNQLRSRVSRIPRPLGLAVRQLLPGSARPPDSGQSIRIEAVLRGWLLRASTTVGSVCDAEGYLFEAVGQLPGMRAAVAAPTGTDWYNTDMVRKAINVKVHRYVEAADSLGLLLVVVLAAEPAMPLSADMLRPLRARHLI